MAAGQQMAYRQVGPHLARWILLVRSLRERLGLNFEFFQMIPSWTHLQQFYKSERYALY